MLNLEVDRYPLVSTSSHAVTWLTHLAHYGRRPNTLQTYARNLEDYLAFCQATQTDYITAGGDHVSLYIGDLRGRQIPVHVKARAGGADVGLSNASINQKLVTLRGFYDLLIEDGLRDTNPVHRGWRAPGQPRKGVRGLVKQDQRLPWIPTEEEWQHILQVVCDEPLRNRLMFALAYDCALRREELCLVELSDIDPPYRQLRIRAETTKNRHERVVRYTEETSLLYRAYLRERRRLTDERGPLFLSVSQRNMAQPVSKWAWSKIIKRIAQHAGVARLTPHTLRHLCLTDLARSGWDIHEIARFAGHQSIESTLLYIHLSGEDLARKLEPGFSELHARRMAMMGDWFQS